MRVALVSREVYPLARGGIGAFVSAAARLLSRVAEVTILTTNALEPTYKQLRDANDPRLPPDAVRIAFVPEPTPDEIAHWYDVVQCYGGRVLERLRELYPDGAPDVIEFPDYLGEGFVTIQAARTFDPFLAGSCLCVRLHTTEEMCVVLNGHYRRDFASRTQFDMERYALGNADRLIWEGGDVLGTYERFYGARNLAPGIRIRYPFEGPTVDEAEDAGYRPGSPLRVLYAGRLERRKGVANLVAAATASPRDDFRLTLVGADTPTGSLGTSMRDELQLGAADDPRIEFVNEVDRGSLPDIIRAHDLVAIPSLWECWPYAALEALHLNRPLLATPVGGLVELVRPGQTGWLTSATGPEDLEQGLDRALSGREELQQLVREARPTAHARALSNERQIIDGYQALASLKPRRAVRGGASRSAWPLVSAIVPYYRAARYVRDAVGSLLAQTYPRVEIVLVNDGSFEDQDWVVAELAASLPVVVVSQPNQGLGAARNFGVSQSRGRYVFPLDCDNIAEPEFIARCVEVLEQRREVAYATSWSRYIEDDGSLRPGPQLGYQPLGNHSALVAEDNVAGDAAAVIRRRIFDLGFRYSEELTSFEDWQLYRELAAAGHYGVVIPERLLRYRVRSDSMQAQIAQPRRAWLAGEMRALLRENGMRWKSSNV